MTGNALETTEQFERISREAADKLAPTRRLTLSKSQYATISPARNRPSRFGTKTGSSFK